MNFDIYAMVKPKNEADVKALLDECLAEAQNLLDAWTRLGQVLEQNRKA